MPNLRIEFRHLLLTEEMEVHIGTTLTLALTLTLTLTFTLTLTLTFTLTLTLTLTLTRPDTRWSYRRGGGSVTSCCSTSCSLTLRWRCG